MNGGGNWPVLLLLLGITWSICAVVIGVEANTRGYSGFGWASLAILTSPFIAACALMAIARIRLQSRDDDQRTPRNVQASSQTRLSAKIRQGAIIGETGEALHKVIRRAPIEAPPTLGPRMEPNFLPRLDEIFSQMRPSAGDCPALFTKQSSFSASHRGAQPELAASSHRVDIEPSRVDRLKIELLKAIGDLMRATDTVDRLRGELAACDGAKHATASLKPSARAGRAS